MTPTETRQDGVLRQRSAIETKALLAYLNGELELPHAPTFLKATMPLLQRALMEQFHETHVEAALTAAVQPRTKLRRNMTHHTLLGLLYKANADTTPERLMIHRLMDDVKILHFDGIHTLTFVFHSRRLAMEYCSLAVRLQGTCIELEDSEERIADGVLGPAQLRRQYAIRVYNLGPIGLVPLRARMDKLPGVHIVDAERPRIDSTEVVDNRYAMIHFLGHECPKELCGVTRIDMGGTQIAAHHHLIHARLPCARCYAPYHTTGFCRATMTHLERICSKFGRVYGGKLPQFQVGAAVHYRHTDAESLQSFLQTLHEKMKRSLGMNYNGDQCNRGTGDCARGGGGGAKPDADKEFQVVISRAARGRVAKKAKRHQDRSTTEILESEDSRPSGRSIGAEPSPGTKSPPHGIKTGKGGKSRNNNPPGLASFTKSRVRGRYAELAAALSDSEDDEEAMERADDAPYAYDATMTGECMEIAAAQGSTLEIARPPGPVEAAKATNMDVDSEVDSTLSGCVGSSPSSQPESAGRIHAVDPKMIT
ncbi:uncharacterized protein KRP23_8105 [Phytophthora ramorum]|uniref:uncharacterized protein n=1 Tax=Phytophthora ramorum TaxID=164328 RepID=UPI0030961F7E|nr:hypothetical protein KRP23_8105 [Phytophthora ramorum]